VAESDRGVQVSDRVIELMRDDLDQARAGTTDADRLEAIDLEAQIAAYGQRRHERMAVVLRNQAATHLASTAAQIREYLGLLDGLASRLVTAASDLPTDDVAPEQVQRLLDELAVERERARGVTEFMQ
jgi:hypothetical protein